ncbi:MAG: HAMP domain-containing protein [Methylobacterium sp.]|uniref:methyl-accepting chemotaxis protein n=1 Tax=Methylobacterium sp. TaxID=409 RepID=UPI002583083A|nr:methyl-accepting chemotaxis protein [Methylobacterium sp.]MBY0297425.1 HAMP domain-containing protein [Methylobacterium sp.]
MAGFLVVLALAAVAFVAVLVTARIARDAGVERDAAGLQAGAAHAIDRAGLAAAAHLSSYLRTGSVGDRAQMIASFEALAGAVDTKPAFGDTRELRGLAARAVEAIGRAREAGDTLNNTAASLASPISVIAEAAIRTGDLPLTSAAILLQGPGAQVAAVAARLVLAPEARLFNALAEDSRRLRESVADFLAQPGVTPRLRKVGTGLAASVEALETAARAYRAAVDARLAAAEDILGAVERIASTAKARTAEADALTGHAAEEEARAQTLLLAALFGGGGTTCVLGILLAVILGRSIARPVVALKVAIERIAAGDLATAVPGLHRRDELGEMAQAVQVLRQSSEERLRLQAESETARFDRDRRALAVDAMIGTFDDTARAILRSVEAAAAELAGTAADLSTISEDTDRRAGATSAAALQTSSSVTAVAHAMEEMSLSIREIGGRMTASTDAAHTAATRVDATSAAMKQLAEAAGHVDEVVTLIATITAQTNLLALNATIEAARAGEAGRGFAVVAGEVKALAGQTAAATTRISERVAAMQQHTAAAVSAIDGIRSSISQVNEASGVVAAAVVEQEAATQDVARNIQQAAIGTDDVTQNTVSVSRAAAEVRAAADRVREAVDSVSRQVGDLSDRIGGFLAAIRAA